MKLFQNRFRSELFNAQFIFQNKSIDRSQSVDENEQLALVEREQVIQETKQALKDLFQAVSSENINTIDAAKIDRVNAVLKRNNISVEVSQTPDGFILFQGELANAYQEHNDQNLPLVIKRNILRISVKENRKGVSIFMVAPKGVKYELNLKESVGKDNRPKFQTFFKSDTGEVLEDMLVSSQEQVAALNKKLESPEFTKKFEELRALESVKELEYLGGKIYIELKDGSVLKTNKNLVDLSLEGGDTKRLDVQSSNNETSSVVIGKEGLLSIEGTVLKLSKIDRNKIPLKEEELLSPAMVSEINVLLAEKGIEASLTQTDRGFIKFEGPLADHFRQYDKDHRPLIIKRPIVDISARKNLSGGVKIKMVDANGARYVYNMKKIRNEDDEVGFGSFFKAPDTGENLSAMLDSEESF